MSFFSMNSAPSTLAPPVDFLPIFQSICLSCTGARATGERNGAEATTVLLGLLVIGGSLELARVVLDGDLHGELGGLSEAILLVADDVTDTGHVLLAETLDVETDVVASHRT